MDAYQNRLQTEMFVMEAHALGQRLQDIARTTEALGSKPDQSPDVTALARSVAELAIVQHHMLTKLGALVMILTHEQKDVRV